MRSIRDVAVFAWAVTGINPSLASYGHGRPRIGAETADGPAAWKPESRPTTYPPPEDLTKESCSATSAFAHNTLYASDPPIPRYRTRHASLDENMYDMACSSSSSSSSSRQAGWPASTSCAASTAPYPYNSRERYEDNRREQHIHHHHHVHHHHHHHTGNTARRPSLLRPAFSYDALHDYARHQQQAYAPASASEAAARRCNLLEEPWMVEPSSSSSSSLRSGCFPEYGGLYGNGFGGGGRLGGGVESSERVGAAAAGAATSPAGSGAGRRYFWE